MKIAIIGCGYVVDHYLKTLKNHAILELTGVTDRQPERAKMVANYYDTAVYESNQTLLADPDVELVVNLTNPESHYEVNKAALLAGKHVYSEKPFTHNLSQAQELVDLAEEKGLLLSGAPCNILSDTVQTMWKSVLDGAIGRIQLVYAEFDDNPIYLMNPEGWTSASGAPWPYRHEYEEGCTVEHAGYHLTWLCALFGPAVSVTAFSSCLVPDKTTFALDPNDTPDFSVACIVFQSGVVARLTCSIIAPLDHRMTIIGNKGMIHTNTYRHYQSPVYIERFNQLNLNARKARSVRTSPFLQWFFGVGGKKQVLVNRSKPPMRQRLSEYLNSKPPIVGAAIKNIKKCELGAQDKFLGVVEMAEAIAENRSCLLPPDFIVHVTELTLAISNAGTNSQPQTIKTTFKPLSPKRATLESKHHYGITDQSGVVTTLIEKLIERAHKH
ncbi:MAG: Gfo/Idh/MocA family oxidoreductase [Methylococcales bacterium]